MCWVSSNITSILAAAIQLEHLCSRPYCSTAGTEIALTQEFCINKTTDWDWMIRLDIHMLPAWSLQTEYCYHQAGLLMIDTKCDLPPKFQMTSPTQWAARQSLDYCLRCENRNVKTIVSPVVLDTKPACVVFCLFCPAVVCIMIQLLHKKTYAGNKTDCPPGKQVTSI